MFVVTTRLRYTQVLLFLVTTPTYVLLLSTKSESVWTTADVVFSRGWGFLVFVAFYADGQQWSELMHLSVGFGTIGHVTNRITISLPFSKERVPRDRQTIQRLRPRIPRPRLQHEWVVGVQPSPQFCSGAVGLGAAIRMVVLDHADILQLVNNWTSGVLSLVSGIDLVYRAYISEEVPRVQGVSEEGWEISAKASRRSTGRFQR